MENYEEYEEFVDEFCKNYEIVHDSYCDFNDEIKKMSCVTYKRKIFDYKT